MGVSDVGAPASPEPLAQQQIHSVLDHWLRVQPDAAALIVESGKTVSWSALASAVDEAARCLTDAGVRPGDRVLVVLENSLPAAAFLLACSKCVAWAVPVNARLSSREVDQIRAHCNPRAVVFAAGASTDGAAHACRASACNVTCPAFGTVQIAGGLPSDAEPIEPDPASRTAVLMYTSGTTGQPKGVMLTHRSLLFVARTVGQLRDLSPADVIYGVLPISHVYGLTSIFLGGMLAGCALKLVPRFDAAHLAQSLGDGVSVLLGVPAMYAKMLDHFAATGRPWAAPKLRLTSSGGAPIDFDLKRRTEERFGITLHNGYGLTEASPTVAQTCDGMHHPDESVGRAIPGIEVRIVGPSDDWRGAIGEIWVRGPNVMKGYYRDRAATEATLTPDGWLRTGDLGRVAENGNLYVVGRLKELIIRSGFNVYPVEIEAVLNSHPGVLLSAVIGRRRSGNEDIIAFVECQAGSTVTEHELRRFAADRLAPYKRPQHIVVLEHLPVTSSGKIKKHSLNALAEELFANNPELRAASADHRSA
jgi:long-chain acyl-CoA synthetase